MKNYLIIGGCGFVGSALAERLISRGDSVTSLDNYFTGSKKNHVEGGIYFEGAASNVNSMELGGPFDIVFYMGEYSRVEQSFEDVDLVFEYNFGPLYQVLKFCKISGAKLVYSGSSTKFGDAGDNGFASPYAWTKKTNTELVQTYAKWFGISYAITYFYNVYGRGEIFEGKYATLIAKFAAAWRDGSATLPVVSPGTQVRNFTHIDDIVSGLLIVADKGEGDGFGIGSDETFSVLDVVDMFGLKPDLLPPRAGNRLTASLNVEKTKALGWRTKNSLRTYITELIS